MALPPLQDTVVRTERLALRPPAKGDYGEWARRREESRAHLEPWEPRWPSDALSRDDWARRLRSWRGAWRNDRAYVFLAFAQQSQRLVGGVSVTNVRRGPAQSASLGYWLLGDCQGKGYMTEAVGAIADWCFTALGLMRLEAGTLPENKRSRRVLDRCGFQEEGFARAYLEIAGRRRDHVLYGRVRDETR